jgi:superfamily II RNA helicase
MSKKGFETRPLILQPAATLYAWTTGLPWEKVLNIAKMEEGDLAMLILRTADNLRHIRTLKNVFPEVADSAATAIDLIMRYPVVMDYE